MKLTKQELDDIAFEYLKRLDENFDSRFSTFEKHEQKMKLIRIGVEGLVEEIKDYWK